MQDRRMTPMEKEYNLKNEKEETKLKKLIPTMKNSVTRKVSVAILMGVLLVPTATSLAVPLTASAEEPQEMPFTEDSNNEGSGEMDTTEEENTTDDGSLGDDTPGDVDPNAGNTTNQDNQGENPGSNGLNENIDNNQNTTGGTDKSASTISVALTTNDSKNIGTVVANLPKVTLDPQKSEEGTSTTMFSQANGGLVFHKDVYEAATDQSKRVVFKEFTTKLQASSVSNQGQTRIFEVLQDSDRSIQKLMLPLVIESTSADIYGGWKIIKPIIPTVRVIFGVLAIGIILGLILSTILDLVFIGLPVARDKIQNSDDGKGIFIIKWVTTDAKSVIIESESDNSGGYTNPYLIYLKRRATTYVIISICILYLVVGEMAGVIDWLLSLGSGLVDDTSNYNP